jgi:hypothetical protein
MPRAVLFALWFAMGVVVHGGLLPSPSKTRAYLDELVRDHHFETTCSWSAEMARAMATRTEAAIEADSGSITDWDAVSELHILEETYRVILQMKKERNPLLIVIDFWGREQFTGGVRIPRTGATGNAKAVLQWAGYAAARRRNTYALIRHAACVGIDVYTANYIAHADGTAYGDPTFMSAHPQKFTYYSPPSKAQLDEYDSLFYAGASLDQCVSYTRATSFTRFTKAPMQRKYVQFASSQFAQTWDPVRKTSPPEWMSLIDTLEYEDAFLSTRPTA